MVFRCYGQHHLRYKGSCQVKKSKNLRKTRIGHTTHPPPAYSIFIFLETIRNMKTTQITQKTQNSPQKN